MFRSKKNALLSIGVGGLFLVALSLPLGAAAPKAKKHPGDHVPATEPAATGEATTIDLLAGIRSGQLTGVAEGTGDGRMIVSITNKTNGKLRVVLPPGLIASGATGQFGGGMGGMGGGMGGGGGGMGGGMGGGGRGGGMGGGRGGSTGGSSRGGGTMPAMMGMMMLGRLIMGMVGDRDSWDQRSLMQGMSGGMGGMGGGMGGMRGMM